MVNTVTTTFNGDTQQAQSHINIHGLFIYNYLKAPMVTMINV